MSVDRSIKQGVKNVLLFVIKAQNDVVQEFVIVYLEIYLDIVEELCEVLFERVHIREQISQPHLSEMPSNYCTCTTPI